MKDRFMNAVATAPGSVKVNDDACNRASDVYTAAWNLLLCAFPPSGKFSAASYNKVAQTYFYKPSRVTRVSVDVDHALLKVISHWCG